MSNLHPWRPCRCLNHPQNNMEYQFPMNMENNEYVQNETLKTKKNMPMQVDLPGDLSPITEIRPIIVEKKILVIQHPLSEISYKILKKDAANQKVVLVVDHSRKTAFPVNKETFEKKYEVLSPSSKKEVKELKLPKKSQKSKKSKK